MLLVIIYCSIAGICGTGFGGLISSLLFRRPSEKMSGLLLSFAGGVLIGIVCFGLIPESLSLAHYGFVLPGFAGGIIAVLLLSYFVGKKTASLRPGILILITIALHNLPVGLAIGAGASYDPKLGLLLVIMIALHNIPEGMAISAPLLAGGLKHGKAIFLTALSGAPTLLGGITGMLIGGISDNAIAISLAAAGGAMLYIVFSEIIPQYAEMLKDRAASVAAMSGILVGLIVAVV